MLSLKEAAYLAELSKISFNDDELSSIAQDMSQIIDLMDSIKIADVESFESDANRAITYGSLRSDVPTDSFDRADILANAKGAKDTFFVARRVVE